MTAEKDRRVISFKYISFFLFVSVCAIAAPHSVNAQSLTKKDSVLNLVHDEKVFPDQDEKGLGLIKDNRLEEANTFFSEELKKNEENREAYFKRGIVKWELNDSTAACRDWSAVLALGDTETYNLLTKKCHGDMTMEKDVIPVKKFKHLMVNSAPAKGAETKPVVDELPSFPGGVTALVDYLRSNLRYPAGARAKKAEGRVYVNFVISSGGNILFPYVVRGIGNGCDEEAIRLVKNMPKWNPAMESGKAVLVRYNIPVKFSLN